MIREKFPGAGSQRPGGRWAIAYSTNSEKQLHSLTGIDNYAAQMKNADPTKSFRDLIVWQKAHELVLGVNELTKQFPKSEMFGLTAQLRSAAVSVPANIAEGYKRRSRADKIRILNIAQGSLEESRYS